MECVFESDPVNAMFFCDYYSDQNMHFTFKTLKNGVFKVIFEFRIRNHFS